MFHLEDEHQWSCSVRDLVKFVWQKGDLVQGQGLGRATLHQGAEGHRWLQNKKPTGYTSEVFLSHTEVRDRLSLKVSGRADGIYTQKKPQVLEEIKTTTQPLVLLHPDATALHWAQAKLYGAIYVAQHGLEQIDLQLTYLKLGSLEQRRFSKRFTSKALADFLEETLASYMDWIREVTAYRAKRNQILENCEFPYPVFRPGQQTLANRVQETVRQGHKLFVQAPTGSGKTMAVLFGAVLGLAKDHIHQIVYLTAKTVGRLAVENALLHLSNVGIQLKGLTITAKSAICPHPKSSCTRGDCPLLEGHFDRLKDAMKALFREATASRPQIEKIGRLHRVCPYYLAMAMMPFADVVIGDYNYVFDPRVSFGMALKDNAISRVFLIDEAHNLVARSRDMFSGDLLKSSFSKLLHEFTNNRQPLPVSIRAVVNAFLKLQKDVNWQDQSTQVSGSPPKAFMKALRHFCYQVEPLLLEPPALSFFQPLIDLYFKSLAFLRLSENPDISDLFYIEKKGTDVRAKLFAIDPSKRLAGTMAGPRNKAVFFSATLTPLDYFKSVLGGTRDDPNQVLPWPFPKRNLGVFLADGLSTRYQQRKVTAKGVSQFIHSFISGHRGNYLVYFPSFEYMNHILPLFQEAASGVEVIQQTPNMTDEAKEQYLAAFSDQTRKTVVGFAVLGGLFGEGIDLVGERLKGAVIVGPALPKVCMEQALIRDHFKQTKGKGFEFAYLYPGMTKVVQAAGRVIRSETDKGALLLIGQRFGLPDYRTLLPLEWTIQKVAAPTELDERLTRFWKVP